MSPQELENVLKQLDAKGASKEEIQQVYDAYKGQSSAPTEPLMSGNKPWLQSTAQSIAKPFLSIGASGAGALEGLAYLGGKAVGADQFAERRRQDMQSILEGVDTGYLGTAKPLGAGAAGGGVKDGHITGAGLADVFGQLGEAGSYFAAPLKGATGFWGAVKSGIPAAGLFGAGEGLQAAGEGKGAIESTATGVANAVGVLATFGLMGKAADVFKIWGAKAMQDSVVRAGASTLRDFADHTFNTLPEAFQKGYTSLADFTNATTRRTVAALRSEFDRNYNTTKDAVIDSLVPEVNNPDLVLGKFQRGLAEELGSNFRAKDTLYEAVKENPTVIDQFPIVNEGFNKIKLPEFPQPNLQGRTSPTEVKAYQEAMGKMSVPFQSFVETMGTATKQPLTLGEIINLSQESLRYLVGSNNSERAAIRSFASGLYSDARNVLEKKNPELLDQWDLAYQAHKKASDLYESNPLNNLKSVGEVDTFVDKMIGGEMSRPERNAFIKALGENKPATQSLFINSVLRKAKELKPAEGAKLIRTFLDNWEKDFLSPEQTKMLDSFASFMDGNFDEFVLGMRNELFKASDLTQEKSKELLSQQTQLDVMKVVNDGRLDQIAERFTKLKDSGDIAKIVSTMTPEEKSLVALSVGKDVYKAELPVATHLGDGKFKIEEGIADAVIKTADTFASNKSLQSLLTPEQITEMDLVAKMAENIKGASYDASGETLANFLRLFVSAFYFKRGWIPGALSKASQTLKSVSDQVEMNRALREMIDQGLTKKGKVYTIGELVQMLPKYLAVPAVEGGKSL